MDVTFSLQKSPILLLLHSPHAYVTDGQYINIVNNLMDAQTYTKIRYKCLCLRISRRDYCLIIFLNASWFRFAYLFIQKMYKAAFNCLFIRTVFNCDSHFLTFVRIIHRVFLHVHDVCVSFAN